MFNVIFCIVYAVFITLSELMSSYGFCSKMVEPRKYFIVAFPLPFVWHCSLIFCFLREQLTSRLDNVRRF